jgi:deoxyribonuclease-4
MRKNLGVHINGGLAQAIKLAPKYSYDCAQIMPTAPMRWCTKEIDEEKASPIVNLPGTGLKKILIHGVYLTNLARKDKQMFHLGKISLVHYLNYAQKLIDLAKQNNIKVKILGVCFHPGSAIDLRPLDAIDRIIYGINWICEQTLKSAPDAKLLLESTAGSGNVLGSSFEQLKSIRDGVREQFRSRIGYVLDTQHTWVSGYDWVGDLSGVTSKIESVLGVKNIAAVHLNDSAKELNSRKDRHANIGDGLIGLPAIKNIILHKLFVDNDIPFIMETPALKDEAGIQSELSKLI